MDIKIHGLTFEIIEEALEKTRKARLYILDEVMLPVISEPRKELSKYAPKMLLTKIDIDKIGDVIGKQGKVIQKICSECNCKVDVEEDGTIYITAIDIDDARRALNMIETIANDPEVGAIYKGVVTKIMSFSALLKLLPARKVLFTSATLMCAPKRLRMLFMWAMRLSFRFSASRSKTNQSLQEETLLLRLRV